ncbi:hypothetical protein [Stackebrandtia nassauensis]|uniref:Uncharacterized protein n=1 Tax=Stackebrandtia nassauensis (strain DSM 44728 / CIP 108903 / NRRL B-16338 / NBRC 102104 / LLR-40K-21) TaxID=446470 RepID=D3Q2V6_STANL|nr:hypothetical protein [Stackebrandtia nassauensis]ADD45857.1 hypothetical protein Snas_6236 [Stackebrandtia nassauensis DSM 44728]
MTNLEVDRIEWMRIYTVTCPVCAAEGPWRLWTREANAGLVCAGCDLDWQHPLVYPAYIKARAERIAAGTDAELPPLEETIGWRPHAQTSAVDIYESDAVAAEYWSPWDRGTRWDVDWPDLWQADGIATKIDEVAAEDAGCDLVTARRLWWVEPEIVATAKEKLAEFTAGTRNRAQFYHGKLFPLIAESQRRHGDLAPDQLSD